MFAHRSLMLCGLLLIVPQLRGQESPTVPVPVPPTTVESTAPVLPPPPVPPSVESEQPAKSVTTQPPAAANAVRNVGTDLPIISVLPFAVMLGCIAVLPLTAGHWWEHNSNRAIVAAVLAVPVALYLLFGFDSATYGINDGKHLLLHAGMEYASFVCLLGSLFIISGGIYIQGSLDGTPIVNTALLAIGAVLASLIGTTGASMVLIRPLIRANASRKHMVHVVIFFIFIVSNCGGLLTPIGDPPLFLGFLKGVPFEWTLQNLVLEWLVVNGILLVVFNIWDQIALNREEKERAGSQLERLMKHEPIRIVGLTNVALLFGVVAVVILKGYGYLGEAFGVQEGLMALLALASFFTTAERIHSLNKFSFAPIIEVAVIFAGIFVTMIPALAILGVNGKQLGLVHQWQYFWACGILSSFLDNAPTYLTFAATAAGSAGVDLTNSKYLTDFLQVDGGQAILMAISCGAVFMGANTYIGNGPNFMVKAIAEENDVKMPSFFGYMAYSVGVLIPIFVVVTFIFFRG